MNGKDRKKRWKKFSALIHNCVNKETGYRKSPFVVTVAAPSEAEAERRIAEKMNGWTYDVGKIEEEL